MMKKIFYGCCVATAALLLLSSCRADKVKKNEKEKEEKEQQEQQAGVKELTIDAARLGFAFVNFETGKVITDLNKDNAKNQTDWDFGVSRFYFKTNSGTSGIGKGGAFRTPTEETKDIKLHEYNKIPSENDWKIDEDGEFESTKGSGMTPGTFATTGLNFALTTVFKNPKNYAAGGSENVTSFGIYTYLYGMPPSKFPPRMEKCIFFVRCANGKIAKCRLDYAGDKHPYHFKLTYIYPVEG